MLREPRNDQQPALPPREGGEKNRRFRIVKLEERIAPGKGGKGTNNNCDPYQSLYSCRKCGK